MVHHLFLVSAPEASGRELLGEASTHSGFEGDKVACFEIYDTAQRGGVSSAQTHTSGSPRAVWCEIAHRTNSRSCVHHENSMPILCVDFS